MSLVEQLTAAKQANDPAAMFALVPYANWLGLSGRVEGDELVTTMTFSPQLIGNMAIPALHGGTLGALLESAAIFELLWKAETIALPKTITLTVDYLRTGATQVLTHARGIVTRQGRRVTNVRMEAWQADRTSLVATAHAIFLIKREP